MKKVFKTMAFTLLGLVLSVNLMAADSGLQPSSGKFIIDFYDSEKLSSNNGTALSSSNYASFVKVAEGLTNTNVVTGVTTSGTVQYGKNGGLTIGSSSANSNSVSFTIGSDYAVNKVTVYATAYESGRWFLNNNAADKGSVGNKGAAFSNVTSPLVWDDLDGVTTLAFTKDNGSGSNQKRLTIYTIVCEYTADTPTPTDPVAPSFTTQPQGAEYAYGATATALSVVAAGTPTPNLQWYSNSSNSTEGATAISGATTASYTPGTSTEGTTYYYCTATNTAGSATSNIVAVIVGAAPVIADATIGTTLWAENFAHFGTNTPSAAGTGTGTTIYGGATISYSQDDAGTKAYNTGDMYAGGAAPELLLKSGSKTWTISGIPSGNAAEMSLTFKSNRTTFDVTTTSDKLTISGSQKSWTIAVKSGETAPVTFDLTLKNTSSGDNARIDDVELKVTAMPAAADQVATPVISTESATPFFEPINVSITCATEGAAVQYSVDNGANWNNYSASFQISATTTIKAKATKAGLDDSYEAEETFTFNPIYASLADLVAAGEPKTGDGEIVRVTLTNEAIVDFYKNKSEVKNGVQLMSGEQAVEIYTNAVADKTDWVIGGTLSGTLTCPWKKYNSTWELCPDGLGDLVYTAPAAKEIASLVIEGTPKTAYEAGESFDVTDLSVKVVYTDETNRTLSTTEYELSVEPDGALSTENTKVTVTATLIEDDTKSTSKNFDITVAAVEGDKLTLASTGVSGTSYTEWTGKTGSEGVAVYAGKSAGSYSSIQLNATNSNGLVSTTSGGLIRKVKVDWNSNTSSTGNRNIDIYGSNTAYTGSGDIYDTEKQGTKLGSIVCGTSTELEVEGDYEYVGIRAIGGALYMNSITFIWSAPKVLEGIAVKTAPTVVDYAAGEFFNPAGLVITATYDDESTEDITYEDNEDKFTFNPALDAALATTDEKVTITYGGKSCDQAITVKNIELTSIVVSGDLSKTDYTEGDDFDFTGLVATGYYSDESHKTITDQVDWSIYPATLTAGQTSVSVIATSGLINGNKSYDITVAAAPLEVTWDASEQGFSNEESVTEANFNAIISAEFDGGKYYTSGTAVRVYGGKTFAIHATSGYKITSIVIGFGSGDKSNEITADCGTYSNGTWTGSSKDVTFTVGGTKDHRRLMTFTVTYEEAAPSAATPTITPSVEAETYFDAITVTLATTTEGAAIYYTTNGDAPTIDPEHAYSEPFQVSATTTIKAIAVKDGLDDSEVATKKFTFGPIFTSLEDLAAADLTKGTTVKVSFENAEIKSIFVTQQGYRNGIYFDIQKGGKDIEIYYQNVPEDWKAGGIVSGTMTCPWTEYNGTWELAPAANSWDWTNLTYKDGESSKEQGTITATYKTSLDADAANDVYEVTYNGDGELSVVSSDPTVATATLEGTTVTIDPLKAGTTTITISAPATDNYTEASKNYTLTVSPALEAASLPFTFTGGKNDINPANGIKQEGLGSDYTAQGITTKLKFDHTDDYVLIWLADAPASMKFDIKGNSFSNGTFDVLESADNVNFTSLASYTEIEDGTKEMNLAATTRYIKFVYTSKSSGNVGLGNIHIAAPEPDFTREDLSNGQLITVCLDKNITKVEGGTFYQINYGTTSEITFAEFAEEEFPIAKATPLLFQSNGTEMKVFCGTDQVADDKVNEIVEYRAMKGIVNTATTLQTPIEQGNILVNGGQLRLVGANCVLTPGHAYIDAAELLQLEPLQPISAPRRTIRLYNPDAAPTNLNGLNGNMKATKVLRDGQFYIIREAKMYNAQGIEVQ